MIIMPFDTETTGLPDWKTPSEAPHQPHLVSLYAANVDSTTRLTLNEVDVIIKPDGWTIEPGMVHGITHEQAMDQGIPEDEALGMLLDLWDECELRIAHNATFDNRIIRIAMKRYLQGGNLGDLWKDPKGYYCTMREYNKIHGGKWPTLEEAYLKLVGRPMENAHNAKADALGCLDVYFKLAEPEAPAVAESSELKKKPAVAEDDDVIDLTRSGAE